MSKDKHSVELPPIGDDTETVSHDVIFNLSETARQHLSDLQNGIRSANPSRKSATEAADEAAKTRAEFDNIVKDQEN